MSASKDREPAETLERPHGDRVRVLLAADCPLVRLGLRALLEREVGVGIVGECGADREAADRAAELKPDVVVLDVFGSGPGAAEAASRIAAAHRRARVIVLWDDRGEGGSSGAPNGQGDLLPHVPRSVVHIPRDDLEQLARLVCNAAGAGPRGSAASAPSPSAPPAPPAPPAPSAAADPLTPRERDVLRRVAEGLSSKQIADRLFISTKTVETHRQRIMDKLGLHNVADLTRYALRAGLTTLQDEIVPPRSGRHFSRNQ